MMFSLLPYTYMSVYFCVHIYKSMHLVFLAKKSHEYHKSIQSREIQTWPVFLLSNIGTPQLLMDIVMETEYAKIL